MASGTLAPRVKYLDIARTIAIISITVNHAVNRSFAVNSNQYAEFHEIPLYLTGLKTVIYAFSRIGVPLFLMISGAFLLYNKRNRNIGYFYKKSFFKIFLPFFLVSMVYFAFDMFWGLSGHGSMKEILKTYF